MTKQFHDQTLSDAALEQLFIEARTYNGWLDKPVSDALLAAIWDLMKMGPTSANMLPARIVWVKSDEAKARLADASPAVRLVVGARCVRSPAMRRRRSTTRIPSSCCGTCRSAERSFRRGSRPCHKRSSVNSPAPSSARVSSASFPTL